MLSRRKMVLLGCLFLLFALTLVLCGCQDGGDGQGQAALGEPFTLAPGQSATIDEPELTLTFAEVLQDWRCPTRVECETAGAVEILVILETQDGQSAQYKMNPDAQLAGFGWAPKSVHFLEYQVELVSVDPIPEEPEDKEDFQDYRATFVVTHQEGILDPSPQALGEPFSLTVGHSATIADQDLTLTFDLVLRDVRCPTEVLCAEEGPVEIIVILQIQGKEAGGFEMNPKEMPESYGWAPHRVTYQGYQVRLVSVDPHPEMPEDIGDFDDYRATFVVSLEE